MWDLLVEAEFEVLRALGVKVYRTHALDGRAPRWNQKRQSLIVGTDITPEEAEDAACEVLGLLVANL